MAKPTTRVQLEMTPKAYERLGRLKEKTEAASYNEVMRVALRLYASVIEQQAAGKKLLLVDKAGNETEYEIFC